MGERRCDRRVACELPVVIKTLDGKVVLSGKCVDVSARGFRVQAWNDWAHKFNINLVGEQLFATIGDELLGIQAMSQLLWCKFERLDDLNQFGFSVCAMMPYQRNKLHSLIAGAAKE